MSQRIDRSQQQLQQQQAADGKTGQNSQFQEGANGSLREPHNMSNMEGGGREDPLDKESPIVALEPEELGLKQGSAFLAGGSKKVK